MNNEPQQQQMDPMAILQQIWNRMAAIEEILIRAIGKEKYQAIIEEIQSEAQQEIDPRLVGMEQKLAALESGIEGKIVAALTDFGPVFAEQIMARVAQKQEQKPTQDGDWGTDPQGDPHTPGIDKSSPLTPLSPPQIPPPGGPLVTVPNLPPPMPIQQPPLPAATVPVTLLEEPKTKTEKKPKKRGPGRPKKPKPAAE